MTLFSHPAVHRALRMFRSRISRIPRCKKLFAEEKKSPADSATVAEFLDFFRNSKECPICQSVAKHLERFYFWFIIESYYNPPMMSHLKKAYGFCKEHTWNLIEAGSPYITAVMYEYLTHNIKLEFERLLDEISQGRKSPQSLWRRGGVKNFPKLKERLARRAACPACATLDENTRRAMENFLGALNDEEMRNLYPKSNGLCVQHLIQVLEISNEPEAIFLLETHVERTQRLNEELHELLRKYDYRYKDEPKGREQNSWVRSGEFFAGKRFDPLALLNRFKDSLGLKIIHPP